jgi:putative hydrolase of the HAD superfamily
LSIRAVLFDLDDTLLWDERSVKEAMEATCRYAGEARGANAKELEEAVRREARALYASFETFPFTQMIGINPFEALWGNFREGESPYFRKLEELAPYYRKEAWTRALRSVGIDDEAFGVELGERFPAERRQRAFVYKDTYPVLDALKEQNYKLLLLTNGSPDLQKEKLEGVPQMAPYFDHIVISGDFGRGKPDAAIFEHAVSLLGISPSEGIMVGDKLTTDILGSSRIGMRNVWINHHEATVGPEHAAPTHIITKLGDLLDILHQYRK